MIRRSPLRRTGPRPLLPWRPARGAARPAAPQVAALLALGLALALALGACSLNYSRGKALEADGRWEEAMLAYRDAVIDDPGDVEARDALSRARKVVARDNFERYKNYLAQKAFRKAYARLIDAVRQDPELKPAQDELDKWERVLVGGQLLLTFDSSQASISLAEEITLTVRINTPNPGETIDAEVDLRNGTFYAEDLVYNRPPELLALYSVNSVGVEMVFGRTRAKQFTSKEFQRFVNVRAPVLDEITGAMNLTGSGPRRRVVDHRVADPGAGLAAGALQPSVPPTSPHYSLRIQGDHILVKPGLPEPAVYTPRFLYLNRADHRVLVDFGRYEARLGGQGQRWTLRRLPLDNQDYLRRLSRNIALQPYFFYREGVFTYSPAQAG